MGLSRGGECHTSATVLLQGWERARTAAASGSWCGAPVSRTVIMAGRSSAPEPVRPWLLAVGQQGMWMKLKGEGSCYS